MSKAGVILILVFLFCVSISIGYTADIPGAVLENQGENDAAFKHGLPAGMNGQPAEFMVIAESREMHETTGVLAPRVDSFQVRGEKDPFLAGLLSWFMLGIGQIYVGDYTKGSLFIAAGFVDKVALVALISHINTKYAPSSDEIVNLNWQSFDGSTKFLIVSYLVSSFGLRFYNVVDAVHSANLYNKDLYGRSQDRGMSMDIGSDAYSVQYNLQFND